MIQLASDPNAIRPAWPGAQPPAREAAPLPARGRNGHAWPFISHQAGKPAAEAQAPTQPRPEHGS